AEFAIPHIPDVIGDAHRGYGEAARNDGHAGLLARILTAQDRARDGLAELLPWAPDLPLDELRPTPVIDDAFAATQRHVAARILERLRALEADPG
ncbi:MAG: hypothetical protein KC656_16895, partial [Myxococcales bacterium]|nr:hypothetical protein [Myxococcales bacterium]